jgi:hypothetical protein
MKKLPDFAATAPDGNFLILLILPQQVTVRLTGLSVKHRAGSGAQRGKIVPHHLTTGE